MITFDEAGAMLDDIADEIPEALFNELNGGITLLPNARRDHEGRGFGGLYILGEYCHDPLGLGRYIKIYFGSFKRVFGNIGHAGMKNELRKTLVHEITHHVESLAGECGLEIKDAIELEKYKRKFMLEDE